MPGKNGTQLCFCGTQRPFSRCCGLYISAPNVSAPSISAPSISASNVSASNVSASNVSASNVSASNVSGAKQVCAPTAEALMRSRYSAFCLGNVDYLILTHHPSMRTDDEEKSLSRTIRTTQWTNLVVLSRQKGRKRDKTGVVEFVAAYATRKAPPLAAQLLTAQLTAQTPDQSSVGAGSRVAQLHERSQFVREGNQWFYLSGEMLPPYQPGRSQPCWCGSSKPFKRCHGQA
ncbi:MAG: YchJ family metal-binding protein [Cyanobacteria bacterium J06555_13]